MLMIFIHFQDQYYLFYLNCVSFQQNSTQKLVLQILTKAGIHQKKKISQTINNLWKLLLVAPGKIWLRISVAACRKICAYFWCLLRRNCCMASIDSRRSNHRRPPLKIPSNEQWKVWRVTRNFETFNGKITSKLIYFALFFKKLRCIASRWSDPI